MSQVFSQQMFGKENRLMDGCVLDLSNPKATVIWPGSFGALVGLNVPSFMVSTPAPAPGSSAVTLAFAPQLPHTFLMGPTIGPSQVPTFRTIQASDIAGLITGFQPLNSILTSISGLPNSAGMLQNNGFGYLSWVTPPTASFIPNDTVMGNTSGAPAIPVPLTTVILPGNLFIGNSTDPTRAIAGNGGTRGAFNQFHNTFTTEYSAETYSNFVDVHAIANYTPTVTTHFNALAAYADTDVGMTSGLTNLLGLAGVARHYGSGNISMYLIGLNGQAQNKGAGNVNQAWGVAGGYSNMGAGTITYAYALLAQDLHAIGVGPITNGYGLYLESQQAAANNWQIYSLGTAPSFFAGPIRNDTLTALTVVYADANKALASVANAVGWLHNDGAGALAWSSPSAAAHDILSVTHTDTLAASVVLGDLIFGNATPKWERLPGNTTTVRQFLRQTGNGAISASPAWDTVTKTDVGLSAVTNDTQAKAGAVGSSGLTVNTGVLLGRSTAGIGAIEEITLGTNLSFTGTVLNASSGSSVTGANPTASHATNAAINGIATTFMRSDAVPAIGTSAVFQLGRIGLGVAADAVIPLNILGAGAPTSAISYTTGTGTTVIYPYAFSQLNTLTSVASPTASATAGLMATTVNLAAATTGTVTNLTNYLEIGSAATFAPTNLTGSFVDVRNYSALAVNQIIGFNAFVRAYGTGTDTSLAAFNGISGIPNNGSQTVTVTSAYGLQLTMSNASPNGTIGNSRAVNIDFTNTGTRTNAYGVYVSGLGTGGTWTNTPYDLYCADTVAWNYIAGSTAIGGAANDATRSLVINGNLRVSDQSQVVAVTGLAGASSTERVMLHAENITAWTPSVGTDATLSGFYSAPRMAATGTTFTNSCYGGEFYPQILSSDAGARLSHQAGRFYALRNKAADLSSYASNGVYGGLFLVGHYIGPPGTIVTGTMAGLLVEIFNYNGTITTANGLDIYTFVGQAGESANPVIGTLYGLRLRAPSFANGGTITNEYGISQESTTARNVFNGYSAMGGATPDSTRSLVVNGNLRVSDQSQTVSSTNNIGSVVTTNRILLHAENATAWSPTVSTDATLNGLISAPLMALTATSFAQLVYGIKSYPKVVSSATGSRMLLYGVDAVALRNNVNDLSYAANNSLIGFNCLAGHYIGPPATISTAAATGASVGIYNLSGTITTAKGLDVLCYVGNGSGPANPVIGTFYGIHLRSPVLANGGSIGAEYGISQDSTTATNVFAGTVRLSSLTASTVVYLNGSRNFVSLANAAGVLTNDGSGALSWGAGGGGGYTLPLWMNRYVQWWFGPESAPLMLTGKAGNGDNVYVWKDSSRYHRDAVQYSALPTLVTNVQNSLSCVKSASGTAQNMILPTLNTYISGVCGDLTIFVAGKRSSITGYALFLGATSAARISFYSNTDGSGSDLSCNTNGVDAAYVATAYAPSTNFELLELRIRGTTGYWYLNGTLIQTITSKAPNNDPGNWTPFLLDYAPGSLNQGCDVYLGSCVLVDGSATDGECDAIRTYLKTQWAL